MVIIDAIVLGGGSGIRFGSPLPKQFQMLGTAPVFIHAVKSLLSLDLFRQIIIAIPGHFLQQAEDAIETYLSPQSRTLIRFISGGERRQDSSRLALEAIEEVSPLPTRVLIHDACRPYLSSALLEGVKNCLFDRSYGAWIPVVPVAETLKRVENHQVVETVDRELVHRVQTPQIFEFTVIRSLVERIKDFPELNFTDDASLCEYYGIPVGVFEGDVRNIKLTYDFERETLRAMLKSEKENASCASESATTFTA